MDKIGMLVFNDVPHIARLPQNMVIQHGITLCARCVPSKATIWTFPRDEAGITEIAKRKHVTPTNLNLTYQ